MNTHKMDMQKVVVEFALVLFFGVLLWGCMVAL
jgi:hypothetical protein